MRCLRPGTDPIHFLREGFLSAYSKFSVTHAELASVIKTGGGKDVNSNSLKIGHSFHVIRDRAAEKDNGRSYSWCHLIISNKLKLAILSSENPSEECTLALLSRAPYYQKDIMILKGGVH